MFAPFRMLAMLPRREPFCQLRLLLVLFEDQTSVSTAEAKTVRQRMLNFHGPRRVRHVIEIALGVWKFVVNGRRRNLIADCQYGNSRFQSARAPQQVSGHRLGRTDRQLFGMLAEGMLDGYRFGLIAQASRSAVRIDVLHFRWFDARIAHGIAHHAKPAVSILGRSRNVKGVRAHSVPYDLRQNARAAPFRMLQFFQYQDSGTFTDDEPIALLVPRTRGALRLLVARGYGSHCGETAN